MTDPAPLALAGTGTGKGLDALLARPLSEADLDRATASLAAPLEERAHARTSLLAVRAGAEILAVRATETARVVPVSRVHRVPHRSNAVFRGIANHEGELLLCMSVEAALGLAPRPDAGDSPAQPAALVVVEHGRERWAFGVDAVIGVTDVAEGDMRAPPMTVSAARSGCVRALARIAEGEACVLDVAALAGIFRGATG